MMLNAKRKAELEKFKQARIHAAGVLASGRFAWTDEKKLEAIQLVKDCTMDGSPPAFAAASEVLLQPPYRYPFYKPYLQERLRALYDIKERKRKHCGQASEEAEPNDIANPRQPPRSLSLMTQAHLHRAACVELETAWNAMVVGHFRASPEPSPVPVKFFSSSNRLYRTANESFRIVHMKHWASLQQPPQISGQEMVPETISRLLRSFKGHRLLPGLFV